MQRNEGYVVSMMSQWKRWKAILYDLNQDIIKSDDEIAKETHDTVKVMPKENYAAVTKDTMDDYQLSQKETKDYNFKDNEANATDKLGLFTFFLLVFCVLSLGICSVV